MNTASKNTPKLVVIPTAIVLILSLMSFPAHAAFFLFPVASPTVLFRRIGPLLPVLVTAQKAGVGVNYIDMSIDQDGQFCHTTTPQYPDPGPDNDGVFECFAPTPTHSTPLTQTYRATIVYNDSTVEVLTVTVKVNK